VKTHGLARLRPLLALLIALTVAVLLFEVTRLYRPDNFIDAFIDRLIGRDFSESELDTVETADITYVEMPANIDLSGILYIFGYCSSEVVCVINVLGHLGC
jgi:hypothetical protein